MHDRVRGNRVVALRFAVCSRFFDTVTAKQTRDAVSFHFPSLFCCIEAIPAVIISIAGRLNTATDEKGARLAASIVK